MNYQRQKGVLAPTEAQADELYAGSSSQCLRKMFLLPITSLRDMPEVKSIFGTLTQIVEDRHKYLLDRRAKGEDSYCTLMGVKGYLEFMDRISTRLTDPFSPTPSYLFDANQERKGLAATITVKKAYWKAELFKAGHSDAYDIGS
jgi:hypothetical protein